MTYPRYYVCLLNFVNGRNLHDEVPPDSISDTELKLMEESAANTGLWSEDHRYWLNMHLNTSFSELHHKLTTLHDEYDTFRIHGISLHPKETLWLEALDKALPLFRLAATHAWAQDGQWTPKDFNPTQSKGHTQDEDIVHRLLIALFQYAIREVNLHKLKVG